MKIEYIILFKMDSFTIVSHKLNDGKITVKAFPSNNSEYYFQVITSEKFEGLLKEKNKLIKQEGDLLLLEYGEIILKLTKVDVPKNLNMGLLLDKIEYLESKLECFDLMKYNGINLAHRNIITGKGLPRKVLQFDKKVIGEAMQLETDKDVIRNLRYAPHGFTYSLDKKYPVNFVKFAAMCNPEGVKIGGALALIIYDENSIDVAAGKIIKLEKESGSYSSITITGVLNKIYWIKNIFPRAEIKKWHVIGLDLSLT